MKDNRIIEEGKADLLNDYAAKIRYPQGVVKLSKEQLEKTLETAEFLRQVLLVEIRKLL